MRPVDLVISPTWTAQVQTAGILEDHSVVIEGAKIVDILKTSEVLARYDPSTHIQKADHILIPGLINAHTHSPMTLLRGMADDLPLMTWLSEHIWPTEKRLVSPDFVTDGTTLAVAEMLRCGVTTFSDMYFFPESSAAVANELGMRMVAGLVCFDNPSAYSANAAECISKGLRLHDAVSDIDLVTTAWAPHAPYTVSEGPWREIAESANALDIPIHTHLHETAVEVSHSVEQFGLRPIERLLEFGVVSHRLIAAHMTQVSPSDQAVLIDSGVSIAHCPESNLKLASGFCRVHELAGAGVNIAIGTDGAASNNDLDMVGEMRTAALLAKGVAGDAAAVPAEQVLAMATINGARALGLDRVTGSIDVGKQADLSLVNLSELSNYPVFNPMSALVYTANREQISDVWVAGRPRVRDGVLLALDPESLRPLAQAWAAKVRQA